MSEKKYEQRIAELEEGYCDLKSDVDDALSNTSSLDSEIYNLKDDISGRFDNIESDIWELQSVAYKFRDDLAFYKEKTDELLDLLGKIMVKVGIESID